MRRFTTLLLMLALLASLFVAAPAEEAEVVAPMLELAEELDEVDLSILEDANAAALDNSVSAPEALSEAEAVAPKAGSAIKLTLGVTETYKLSVKSAKTYKSSNAKVAKVSKKGVITARKVGKATITVTNKKGKKTKVTVTVKKAPKKLTLNKSKLTLEAGKTYKLKVKLPSKTASNKITWKSKNKKVAKVSSTGKVTAVKAGRTKITATAFNGVSVTCTVTVKAAKAEEEPAVPEEPEVPEEQPPKVKGGKVGVAMPTADLIRWNLDGKNLEAALTDAGCDVNLVYAGNDVVTQIQQIENLIVDGCDVLIIAAIDVTSLNDTLKSAKAKGIPVIAYDRLLMDTEDVSYYVTFDNAGVGRVQGEYIRGALKLDSATEPFNIEFTAGDPGDRNAALFFDGAMSVLEPYIKSGKLVVLSGETDFSSVGTRYWSTDNAQARAKELLTKYYQKVDVDAWLCSNDSTACGVIAALEGHYSGKWPVVTGQDCDIANVGYIRTGKQAMSVFKDTHTLANRAAVMACQLLLGDKVTVNDTTMYDNGAKVVPTYLCAPTAVTAKNYREVLGNSGFYTADMLG